MARQVKAKVAIPIGLDNVYIAPLLTDTEEGTTYETPEFCARAIKATMEPILSEGTLDSDDEVEIDESMIIGYTVSFEASQIDDYMRAKIFGHQIDQNGGLIVSKNDKAPELALLFRSMLSDKKNYKYTVLYKGKFKPNSEEYETAKREGITYKTESAIEGNFYCRTSDGVAKYSLRSDNPEASADIISKWFTTVQQPADIAEVEPGT